MKTVPSYTKIMALGSSGTENALNGFVYVQEKVDGSQFSMGVNEDGQVVMRSHHQDLHAETYPKMFMPAIDYVLSLDMARLFDEDTYFYCEYLGSPKHNTLSYARIPTNHLILFDALVGGAWANRPLLEAYSETLGIDVVPELWHGDGLTLDTLKGLLATPSYLGNETVEGVVIKNHDQHIVLGGHYFPIFTKMVNEKFKERHKVEWKKQTVRGNVDDYVASFASEARWQKAVQHLAEQGRLLNAPQDIGPLIKEVDRDIKEEEIENIKTDLYRLVIGEILRKAKAGLPEWYKAKLLDNLGAQIVVWGAKV
jgi:hypothetical protein